MEFFNGNIHAENGLSLADMMESDLKSEFSDGDLLGQTNFEVITSLSDFNLLQNGLGSLNANSSMEVDKASNLGDLSWLQNVSVSSRDVVQPENNDPNLLVNPQTGLPITQAQPSLSVAVSGSNGGIVKVEDVSPGALTPQDNRVQFVNTIQGLSSPPQPTTIAQTQTFIQQNGLNSPVQTIHSPSQHTIQSQRPGVINLNNYQQQQAITTQLLANSAKKNLSATAFEEAKSYPKPVYSYSCLIAMALKNSDTGALPVSEIYSFMT